jgi:hypothetical protein
MDLSPDIRVSEYDHVFLHGIIQMGIKLVLCLHVGRSQEDMVVVLHDGEGSFEEGTKPILSYRHSGPANSIPTSIIRLNPRRSFENPVVISVYRFGPRNVSLRIKKLHLRILRKDIMIGFQGKL